MFALLEVHFHKLIHLVFFMSVAYFLAVVIAQKVLWNMDTLCYPDSHYVVFVFV